MSDTFARIHQEIIDDPMNADMTAKGYMPVYAAHPKARIVIVGQAPGIRAQMSMKSWNDASGDTLRSWLDIGEEVFYDPDIIALLCHFTNGFHTRDAACGPPDLSLRNISDLVAVPGFESGFIGS